MGPFVSVLLYDLLTGAARITEHAPICDVTYCTPTLPVICYVLYVWDFVMEVNAGPALRENFSYGGVWYYFTSIQTKQFHLF